MFRHLTKVSVVLSGRAWDSASSSPPTGCFHLFPCRGETGAGVLIGGGGNSINGSRKVEASKRSFVKF